MTKLLLDEMLSGDIAEQLRTRGLDCVAVVERRELPATRDEALLAIAAAEQRCLVTSNSKDFAAIAGRWLAQNRDHHGLVFIHSRPFKSTGRFAGSVIVALSQADLPGPDQELFLRPVS